MEEKTRRDPELHNVMLLVHETQNVRTALAGDIYRLRRAAKLSQTELARRVGATKKDIDFLESDLVPGSLADIRTDTLLRIAILFGKKLEIRLTVRKRSTKTDRALRFLDETLRLAKQAGFVKRHRR